MAKHKHKFQVVSIIRTSRLPFKELAVFICECGKKKEVEVKE